VNVLRIPLAAATAALSLALVATTVGPAHASVPYVKTQRTGTSNTVFTVSSFNVLGSSHTAAGGKLARWASGTARIKRVVNYLDTHNVGVVGFQEMQMDQYDQFVRSGGDRYGIQHAGYTRRGTQNSIAWDKEQWGLVSAHTTKIPYFSGIEWDMPYVLLKNQQTGQQAYFANFHNPATNKRNPGSLKWRKEATRRQAELVNTLLNETRTPVFVTGDMNEREVYYCNFTGAAPMKAANGGTNENGVCTPPPNPMPVNWIFGAKRGGAFSNWVRDVSARNQKITDHFVIRADVRILAGPVAKKKARR
jgi:hypothetical protein